ncbi:hypothetical protein BDZ97DRAFT_182787 [Flammula alnicola]|nr:hypothetical protein BDZ97DRAFT_182787 [Flammula alnicola]
MGDPSALRFISAESASTPIDWSKVPEASREFFHKGWGTDWRTEKMRPLPATIGGLADMLHGSKFFGYLDSKRCTLLLDISEFGIATSATARHATSENTTQVGPRFYMRYSDEVWFVLLIPGVRNGAVGYSPKVEDKVTDETVEEEGRNDGKGRNDGEEGESNEEEGESDEEGGESDEDEIEVGEEDYDCTGTKPEEIAMAQAFDAKLDQQIRRPGALDLLDFTKTLGGWSANSLKSSLQAAEFGDAMMTLPLGHPALNAFLQNTFAHLR